MELETLSTLFSIVAFGVMAMLVIAVGVGHAVGFFDLNEIGRQASRSMNPNRAFHEVLVLAPSDQVERLKGLIDSVFVVKELEQESDYEQYVCYALDTNNELHVVLRSPKWEKAVDAGKTLSKLHDIHFEDRS